MHSRRVSSLRGRGGGVGTRREASYVRADGSAGTTTRLEIAARSRRFVLRRVVDALRGVQGCFIKAT